jgi:multicomponent Na+:H+ antiporter subunit E
MRRVIGLWAWAYLVWTVLTWTFTLEQVLCGVAAAAVVAVALAPLGEVSGPWALLRPGRLMVVLRILATAAGRSVVANLRLSRRIWAPSRPLESGMVVVPTHQRTDGGLTAVALITSLIVDDQFVDLDRARGLLQYHAVSVPSRDPVEASRVINMPVERLLEGGRE